MRIHYLQHVPFEGIANIGIWAKERRYIVSETRLYQQHVFPALDRFDCLIIMGGPMNVYEEKKYPWLVHEKKYIGQAIEANKIVIGFCLGAQLIADVLGAKVYRNKYKEIGWYLVSLTKEAKSSPVFSSLDDNFIAFHWHGDTFSIPARAKRIAETEACKNQAFEYKQKVFGIQFHLELSYENIKSLVENCVSELHRDRYIQVKEEILLHRAYIKETEMHMVKILDNVEEFCVKSDKSK